MQPLDPEAHTETEGRATWERWAAAELHADDQLASAAVEAALRLLSLGTTPAAAVVAAKLSAGRTVSRREIEDLYEEVKSIHHVTEELESVVPSGELTKAGLAQLRQKFQSRQEALDATYKAALVTLAAKQTAAAEASQAGSVATQSAPGPSMQEFFADNSILVISVAGAFLLIVATLLFEIYGTSGFGGEVRFGGVFALDLVFGAAGYVCLRRPRLRIVGQTYVVIFALMAPLTIAAAYVFLGLRDQGITVELAVGLGGSSCAVLYAILAHRLQSRGYALMSLVALAVGAFGLVNAFTIGIWSAAWMTSLVFAYIAIAYPPSVLRPLVAVHQRVAEPFIHAAALLALLWSLGTVLSLAFAYGTQSFQLTTTTALLTAAYALYCWRARRSWMFWAVWTGVSLTVVSANDPLGFGQRGLVIELAALAWAYAIGARYMPGSSLRGFVKLGAAVQAALPVLASASPSEGLQAAALFATAGIGVLFALQAKRPAWLLLTVGIFSVDWFWIAKSLLPPPQHPTADTLALTYSPLPAIYLGLGIALRQMGRTRWAWPFYTAGGLLAIGVPIGAMTQNDLTLAGRSLLVYSGLSYVAATLHRFWPGLVAAVVASAASILLLLAAAAAALYWYPVAMAAAAALVYGAHLAWGKGEGARAHRITGLALAGLTTLSCFEVPGFWDRGATGALTSLIALLTFALLILVDGRLTNRLVLDYVAAVAASVGGFWLGRYFGMSNPQVYVVLPGLVLIASGLLAPHDSRHRVNLDLCRAAIGLGAFALMATSAAQSVSEDAGASYIILWVIEAIVALLVGIGFRSRTLVIAGGIGLGLGAIRALVLILQSVQVYVVFGVVAILLLIGAGLLAAVRDRIGGARSAMTQSWRDWT